MPSNKYHLLVKSLVASELLLPLVYTAEAGSEETPPTAESVAVMSAALDVVDIAVLYNPLTMNTGLHECLKAQLSSHQQLQHHAPSRAVGNKRKMTDRYPVSTSYMQPIFKPMP